MEQKTLVISGSKNGLLLHLRKISNGAKNATEIWFQKWIIITLSGTNVLQPGTRASFL